jgi:lauroyl/myristoyl acyltransferase
MSLMHTGRIEIVDRQMAEILAAKTEAERLAISWGMWRSARRMLTQLLTHEHADWSSEKVQEEVSRRLASGS